MHGGARHTMIRAIYHILLVALVWASEPQQHREQSEVQQRENTLTSRRLTRYLSEDARNLLAGAAGGAAMVYSGQPLDRIKVNLQTAVSQYRGALDCLRQTVASQGVLSLYKGTTPALAGEMCSNVIMYCSYRAMQRGLIEYGFNDMVATAIAGAGSGVLVAAVDAPAELVKIRMQTRPELRSASECLRDIIRADGLRGLFTGAEATLLRNVPMVSMYYLSYYTLKDKVELNPFISGGIAGTMAWIVALPLDTIKSKIQASSGELSVSQCVRNTIAEEGARGLMKGAGPVLARAFLVNACGFAATEAAQSVLSSEKE